MLEDKEDERVYENHRHNIVVKAAQTTCRRDTCLVIYIDI